MYAYAVDGFGRDERESFDAHLNAPSGAEAKELPAKKRDQARAQQELMAAMGKARG